MIILWKGWTPTPISISSRPAWVEEARTQRWACEDAPAGDPTLRRWSETSAPRWPLREKRFDQ